jgi:hypothetical protein
MMIQRAVANVTDSSRNFGARKLLLVTALTKTIAIGMVVMVLAACFSPTTEAKADNFNDVVKVIERFYRVKHKGIPFLARAGMKTAVTAARIAGGSKKRLAEIGSVKVAYFEDQEFNSGNGIGGFKTAINTALGETWSPLIQVSSPKDGEQVYIFLREAGEKFNVLVITIERRDASVVQVTLSPAALAKLMQDPNEMGQSINADATSDDE